MRVLPKTWNRIEPHNLSGTVAPGLAAPLADPLWMLGRQWQLGELTAEDASTPVAAVVKATAFMIDRLDAAGQLRAIGPELPLEALVEPEPPEPPDLRLRLSAGRDLLAQLSAAAAAKLVAIATPAPVDRLERALVLAVGATAVDAELVIAHDPATLAGQLGADESVIATWRASYLARTGRAAPTAWNEASASYAFSLRAPVDDHDVVLTAGAYRGGRLDWSDFTASTQPRPGDAPTAVVTQVTSTKLPVPLDFAGGPARRYYELEPSGTSLSLLAGAPHDLATALLLEVALVYGGDWFVLPLELPVGSLSRVDSISLVDAFGTPTAISGRLRSPGWRAFECAPTTDPAAGLLAILPTVALPLEGEPLESIALVRDERANVVWAIEDLASDALGIARTISHPTPTLPAEATYTYLPFVPPPASWFPLVRRDGNLVGATFHGVTAPPVPRGRMLGGWPAIKFLVDDVHDDGLRIERRWQVAFGRNNARAAWISRRDRSAGAPASSGIAADVLVAPA